MDVSTILLVEDSATDALIVKHALRKHYQVDHVRDLELAKELLLQKRYALVVSDYFFPGGTVADLQHWISEHEIDVPVIVISGQGDERVATAVLKRGAYDYIVKSEQSLSSLPVAIEQVLRRHELERHAQILQQIVENASDAIITMEKGGSILTANQAVQTMLGYTPDEIVGQPARLLFPDITDETGRMFDAEATDRSWQGELNARRKDGAVLPVHMSTSVLRDRAGKPLRLIGIARDMTERYELLHKLKHLSITDDLTGLSNHRFFHDRLHYEFIRARRYHEPLGCIMIDVDYFKAVNDTYGHLTGDKVLKSLAEMIAQATRTPDIVARYGGEEFSVLLPNTNLAGTLHCAEHIWETVGTSEVPVPQGALRITVSAGATALTPDVRDEEELLRRADAALLNAKRRGRNKVCVWQESDTETPVRALSATGADTKEICRNLRRLIQPAISRYMESVRPILESLYRHKPELQQHAANVTIYAMELARKIGMNREEELALQNAAQLHDIGHVLTPSEVIHKHGPLSPVERRAVQAHARAGEQFIAELQVFTLERPYVRHHHERYDGKGYPDGLAGEEIPLGARILAIADAYDAMTSGRPHWDAMSKEEADTELLKHAGTQFDPKLVEVFLAARQAYAVT